MSDHMEGFQAENKLLRGQLQLDQKRIREAHEVLTRLGAPTNGEEGEGKRQDLSLAQRIERLFKDGPFAWRKADPLSQALNEGDGSYKP